jgi:hypothetical protein
MHTPSASPVPKSSLRLDFMKSKLGIHVELAKLTDHHMQRDTDPSLGERGGAS